MNSPLVSVILPNYNHAKYLDERIQSILNQTYCNFELIILDDCSSDNGASKAVIEKYRENSHGMKSEYAQGIACGAALAKTYVEQLPSAQTDTEKICARIKAEAIKRNVEYMKHGNRYMLGFVDGMRLARRIVDGTVDEPVYFTTSGE